MMDKVWRPHSFLGQKNDGIFTEKKFTFTNPKEGTIMNGEGMDFNKDFSIAKST